MPGFGDSAFIILLALLLFGPKKLPVLARQLGKLMADFRRASNEFRTQMEEELRISEQADRQKQIAALEASAPSAALLETPTPDDPHTPPEPPAFATPDYPDSENESQVPTDSQVPTESQIPTDSQYESQIATESKIPTESQIATDTPAEPAMPAENSIAPPATAEPAPAPLPIATAGDLTMMPPSTGLPVPNNSSAHTTSTSQETELETETLHG